MVRQYRSIFVFICIADLLVTVVGMNAGFIEEDNAMLCFYLQKGGIEFFALTKLLMLFFGIFLIERAFERGKVPQGPAVKYYQFLILTYAILYVLSAAVVNLSS